jgi:hypothetical protein
MAPPKMKPKQAAKPVKTAAVHPCDACGHSTDGSRITDAKFEIAIPGDGSIFLCGHHMAAHRLHILHRNYEVKEHVDSGPGSG